MSNFIFFILAYSSCASPLTKANIGFLACVDVSELFFPSLQRSVLKAAGMGESAWLQESAAVRMDGWAAPATPVSLDAHSHAHQRTSANCLTEVLVCQMVWSALNWGSVSAERKFLSLSFLQM